MFNQNGTTFYLTSDHKSCIYVLPLWYWHTFEYVKPEDIDVVGYGPEKHYTIKMFGKQKLFREFSSYAWKF